MKLYNTLTGQEEEFVPADGNTVKMYICGVTPYSSTHVGHALSYVIFDVLRRYLEHIGYQVQHVQNFTDVDDKIILRARMEGISEDTLTERYIDDFFSTMDALNIQRAHAYPRATQEIPGIIKTIKGLIEQGYAYPVNGNVYFRVKQKHDYGKLSHRTLEGMIAGARIQVDEEKEHPMDFALWKGAKAGEPSWDSPWGPGRPGWHIECTSMALDRLGDPLDIHGGGQDLVFPHHENEIAQSEASTGMKPFARYWVHNGLLMLGEDKMSKSLGNTVGILADEDAIWERVQKAVTDPQRVRRDDPGRPEVCNVFTLHQLVTDASLIQDIEAQCRAGTRGCVDCKRIFADSLVREFAPFRERAEYLRAHPEEVRGVLEAGADPNARVTKHLWYMGYTFDQMENTSGATPFWRAAYATDVEAMRLLMAHGADPNTTTLKVPARRFRRGRGQQQDYSGLAPVPDGGPAIYPIHAASGVGYGEGFAANAHRHVPDGWLPAVKYLIEEVGADVNARDVNGYSPVHHAAARGDNEVILYLVEHGADVTFVSRRGQTTADMANGPVQRIQPFPETVALLERLGSKNNHNCVSC